ncbi:MAG: phosphodiesterase YaeI [Bryobacteraceae bacterium]|nr:phosphodiesterase YaeI [Bryobacteraceae bacterium]
MTRRRLLFAAGAPLAAGAYPVAIEPSWLELTVNRIHLGGRQRGFLRILQLTDLHASFEVSLALIEEAIGMGLAAKPDLACLTGDFITRGYSYRERPYADVIRRLSKAMPAFAVLGNHDGGGWARLRDGHETTAEVQRLLESAGVQLLHNRSQTVEVRGSKFEMTGVGDLWADEVLPDRAFKFVQAEWPVVLLAHNPDSKEIVRRFPWDVMLSGHTHGGQVVLPAVGPYYAPVKDKRFIAGLKRWDGRHIYVSRGVGSLAHVRFMCRPEVTILDISTGEAAR